MNNTPPPDDIGSLQSPIRPQRPASDPLALPAAADAPPEPEEKLPTHPADALEVLRQKMETTASEFAEGKINRAQFKAIYARYTEQRAIIERLLERDPEGNAWKSVASPGHTSFLRSHFEARALYYLVFLHNQPRPLIWGGKQHPEGATVMQVLKMLWTMPNRPKYGIARREIGDGHWLVVTLGEFGLTMVLYSLEPSAIQLNALRDMHSDFERANRVFLQRGKASADTMVFPQRALVERGF